MPESLRVDCLTMPHGFFTRRGGVSAGPFASLNCSISSQDDPQAVRENRARVARSLRIEPSGLVGLTQVHGIHVEHVTIPWQPGQGPRADAMVTDRPGIALGIVTADCAPVLLEDAHAGIVGAAHAGWRGAMEGVIEAMLKAMVALGARADRVAGAIGPCIAQASYEVGADLRDAVLARPGDDARFFRIGMREARWQFDLPNYCATRMAAAGIGQIEVTGADTMADEDRFFSHRRRTLRQEGPIGHQISVIALPV